jgi:hypothetical protein
MTLRARCFTRVTTARPLSRVAAGPGTGDDGPNPCAPGGPAMTIPQLPDEKPAARAG